MIRFPARLNRIAALAVLLTALPCARAQSAPPPLDSVARGTDKLVSADKRALSDAKDLAKKNDAAGAERVLAAGNLAPANTAGWHMETSHNLTKLASELAREGAKVETVKDIGRQALKNLDDTVKKSSDKRVQGQARAAAGAVQEKVMGDVPAAIAAYRDAVTLDPVDKHSSEALGRLEAAEAMMRSRIKPKKS